MFSVVGIPGELSSSMAILDGDDEVGIGLDLSGEFVAHSLDQIVAGQQGRGLTVGQAFLGRNINATMVSAM